MVQSQQAYAYAVCEAADSATWCSSGYLTLLFKEMV